MGRSCLREKREPVIDPSCGWDGSYKGKKRKPDVYIYQLEIICGNGEVLKVFRQYCTYSINS